MVRNQTHIPIFLINNVIIVFLNENQVVKLGDFGLSKALGAASFANTYVGVSLKHWALALHIDHQ